MSGGPAGARTLAGHRPGSSNLPGPGPSPGQGTAPAPGPPLSESDVCPPATPSCPSESGATGPRPDGAGGTRIMARARRPGACRLGVAGPGRLFDLRGVPRRPRSAAALATEESGRHCRATRAVRCSDGRSHVATGRRRRAAA